MPKQRRTFAEIMDDNENQPTSSKGQKIFVPPSKIDRFYNSKEPNEYDIEEFQFDGDEEEELDKCPYRDNFILLGSIIFIFVFIRCGHISFKSYVP